MVVEADWTRLIVGSIGIVGAVVLPLNFVALQVLVVFVDFAPEGTKELPIMIFEIPLSLMTTLLLEF